MHSAPFAWTSSAQWRTPRAPGQVVWRQPGPCEPTIDRCVYWSLRWAASAGKNVLCINIDSMDKTKFAYPRFPTARLPKAVERCLRPKLVFTAALAHGYCYNLYTSEENFFHGGSHFIEVLPAPQRCCASFPSALCPRSRTIEDVARICREPADSVGQHCGAGQEQRGHGSVCHLGNVETVPHGHGQLPDSGAHA